MTAPLSESELIGYMAQLVRIEQDPHARRAELRIGPYTAITLIGAIQLASRYPAMEPATRTLLRGIVDQLKPLFEGTLGEEIIRRGEHPEWDQ